MSIYAVVLEKVKEVPAQTAAQLSTLLHVEETPVDQVLVMLVHDGRVTKTGVGAGATYTSTSQQ